MKLTFEDLNNRHSGETILIVGSGSSADVFNDHPEWFAPYTRILLNHQCLVADVKEGATYGLWTDDQVKYNKDFFDQVKPGVQLVLPEVLRKHGEYHCLALEYFNAIVFKYHSAFIQKDRGIISGTRSLYTFCGTATTAAHLAYYLGANKVTLVGIDGTERSNRAAAVKGIYSDKVIVRGSNTYARIKEYVISLFNECGLPYCDISESDLFPEKSL